jgi:hypothetical protein
MSKIAHSGVNARALELAIYRAHSKVLLGAGESLLPQPTLSKNMSTRKKIVTLTEILSKRPDGRMPLEIILETMDLYRDKYTAYVELAGETEDGHAKLILLEYAEEALQEANRIATLAAPFCHQRFASVQVTDAIAQPREEQEFVISFSDPSEVPESDEARIARENRAKRLPHHMKGRSPNPYKSVPAEAQIALKQLRDAGVVDISVAEIEEVLPPDKVDQSPIKR